MTNPFSRIIDFVLSLFIPKRPAKDTEIKKAPLMTPDYTTENLNEIAQVSVKMADERQRDLLFCTATLVGEARSEGNEGMQAVMNVIQNRLKSKTRWWKSEAGDHVPDNTLAAVCVDAWQFSCWNDGTRKGQKRDPNFNMCLSMADPDNLTESMKDNYFFHAFAIAQAALDGALKDITHGSTHYHTKGVAPAWSKGIKPAIVIKRHKFYNNIS